MNLAEALNVALPDIPVRTLPKDRPPKLDPNLIAREQIQDGKPTIMVLIPSTRLIYPMPSAQWDLMCLFDGTGTYEEIAQLQTARTSVLYTETYVREFAELLSDQPFWSQTAQERNIALWEKLKESRRRRTEKKSRFGNLAEIKFSAWDPDTFLTKVHEKLSFVFTRGFLIFNLVLFSFMTWVWIDRWGEIWNDSLEYYNFTHKGVADLVEFWLLILVIGFIHECSHGLACKHTGAEVHSIGFLLIYLEPCFFCDVTEAWMFGDKWQRITTMVAGLWSELLLCGFATLIWWGTPPGGFVHEMSYKIILIGGLAAVLINLNPLVKLDGYFIFTEMVGITDLKELSTGFTTSWIKKKIFKLPVEIPFTPWRRRLLFVPYSILSGFYGYALLFFVVLFVYHAVYNYTPEWAFVPAIGLSWVLFRSRIRTFGRFLKTIYLDKKEFVISRLKSRRGWALAAALVCFAFAPIWREAVSGGFILEPVRKSVIRAHVPGRVTDVKAAEGEKVEAGATLLRLRDLKLESELAKAESSYEATVYRLTAARLHNAPIASPDQERRELETRVGLLRNQAAQLALTSEISGFVVTPRMDDLIGSYVPAGAKLGEVVDLSRMKARIYVAENELRKIHPGSVVKLRVQGLVFSLDGVVLSMAPASAIMEPGVMAEEKYAGLHAPHYYFADIDVPNNTGLLKAGMTGEARIFVRRRSLAGLTVETVTDFVSRKLW